MLVWPRSGRGRSLASPVVGLALLALALLAATGVSVRRVALMLRPQRDTAVVADRDAAAFGAGMNGANWDKGWLRDFTRAGSERGRRNLAAARSSLRSAGADVDEHGNEVEQIHALLDEAVSMMADLDRDSRHTRAAAPVHGATASDVTAAAEEESVASRATRHRLQAYEDLKRTAELPQCFKVNDFGDQDKDRARQRMSDAASNLVASYPTWAKAASHRIPGKGQRGEWRHDRGPPYVQRVTMFAGPGVDTLGNGNLVRRVLGLKTAFGKACDLRSCDHAMSGNQYIKDFDGSQFRFLYRNACSNIVIPPLTKGAGPVLSDNGLFRLHHYLKDGFNTMVVCGSTASVLFLNQNVATLDGGFNLEPAWVEGPYEAQAAQRASTPFAALAATLPGQGVGVTGVHVSSLPSNAISYYEAEDISVVFEIPMGQGRLIYLGYDFSEPVTPWVHALVAATMFTDFDFEGSQR